MQPQTDGIVSCLCL